MFSTKSFNWYAFEKNQYSSEMNHFYTRVFFILSFVDLFNHNQCVRLRDCSMEYKLHTTCCSVMRDSSEVNCLTCHRDHRRCKLFTADLLSSAEQRSEMIGEYYGLVYMDPGFCSLHRNILRTFVFYSVRCYVSQRGCDIIYWNILCVV